MSRQTHDCAMRAVARVRAVRERDSRLGLLHALGSVRDRQEQLTRLQDGLTTAGGAPEGTLDGFVTARRLLAGMALSVREAERGLAAARTVATDAHHRWQTDKSRVAAVERLLEERARQRAEEERRTEVRSVDDIVGARHAQNQGTTRRGDGR